MLIHYFKNLPGHDTPDFRLKREKRRRGRRGRRERKSGRKIRKRRPHCHAQGAQGPSDLKTAQPMRLPQQQRQRFSAQRHRAPTPGSSAVVNIQQHGCDDRLRISIGESSTTHTCCCNCECVAACCNAGETQPVLCDVRLVSHIRSSYVNHIMEPMMAKMPPPIATRQTHVAFTGDPILAATCNVQL
jgi:hypothetical protein